MTTSPAVNLKPLAPGAILALLAILLGFGLGGVFGVAEDALKTRLSRSADEVIDTVYEGDTAKRDATVGKSWSYLKRAHLHGGAIGAAALGATLLLSILGAVGRIERLSSIALGAGAIVYSTFWLLAGLKAPALGGTGAAKEALEFLAVPGAGLCLLGLVGTIFSIVKKVYFEPEQA